MTSIHLNRCRCTLHGCAGLVRDRRLPLHLLYVMGEQPWRDRNQIVDVVISGRDRVNERADITNKRQVALIKELRNLWGRRGAVERLRYRYSIAIQEVG